MSGGLLTDNLLRRAQVGAGRRKIERRECDFHVIKLSASTMPASHIPAGASTTGPSSWPHYIGNQSATITFVAAKITINNNGPIRIEGDFTIHDAEGKEFGLAGRTVISLCRCGMSQNKPFCDGQHKTGPFESVCGARELAPPAPKPPVSLG